jgi:hypothetical protein
VLLHDLGQPLHVESRIVSAAQLRYPGEVWWLPGRRGGEDLGEFLKVLFEARWRDNL